MGGDWQTDRGKPGIPQGGYSIRCNGNNIPQYAPSRMVLQQKRRP